MSTWCRAYVRDQVGNAFGLVEGADNIGLNLRVNFWSVLHNPFPAVAQYAAHTR